MHVPTGREVAGFLMCIRIKPQRGKWKGQGGLPCFLLGVESGRGQNRIIRDFRLESLAS